MTRAAVIGSGPNGLSAAIELARAGVDVCVYEGGTTVGGAARTAEVTLPGFQHDHFRFDLGSSVYPMGVASPFFSSLPLKEFGLRWIEPEAPLAHPLDDGTAVMLEHSLEETARGLEGDGAKYIDLIRPLTEQWAELSSEILGPVLHWPSHPLLLARFGVHAVMPATSLAKALFHGPRARALFAGIAAHSVMPLESVFSSAVGLVLGAAGHSTGWPVAAGGAQAVSDALAGYFRILGGKIETGCWVRALGELDADLVLGDVSPRQLLGIAGEEITPYSREKLGRFRYGPGAFKVDWALSEPIPWSAKACSRAATVHVGGTLEEIAASERAPWEGRVSERPFVLVTQPSLFDATRAPEGRHTAWGYCHVPNGYAGAIMEQIEAQVERFAPGFRECVLARHVSTPASFEAWNPNLVGGDLSGGAMTPRQLLFRPSASLYRVARKDGRKSLYLGSASTPPGGGVHGMCGYHAARTALADLGLKLGTLPE
jgi:phytoene dehydrogenase-like protein